jgi:hypothetical protein
MKPRIHLPAKPLGVVPLVRPVVKVTLPAKDSSPRITFPRVRRECPYNERAEQDGNVPIYDFNVCVDGVVRAEFRKDNPDGRGYTLLSAADEMILQNGRREGTTVPIQVASQNDFLGIIETLLEIDDLPTYAQNEARKAEISERSAREKREKEERNAELDRIDRLNAAAPALLAALEAIIADDCLTTGTTAKARATIALAKEGK